MEVGVIAVMVVATLGMLTAVAPEERFTSIGRNKEERRA